MKKILYLFLVFSPLLFVTSCEKEEDDVAGCTNSQATNYNSNADTDDGSCEYSIIGMWAVDDYTLNGVSLFSPLLSPHLTSMSVTINENGTSSSLAYYSDNSMLGVDGSWLLIGTSTLRLTNEFGDTTDWMITELNGSNCELYCPDLLGEGVAVISLLK